MQLLLGYAEHNIGRLVLREGAAHDRKVISSHDACAVITHVGENDAPVHRGRHILRPAHAIIPALGFHLARTLNVVCPPALTY